MMGVLFDVTPVEKALDRLLAYTYPCVDIRPTILISNPTSRAQRVVQYSKLLDDVDETHSAIARLEAQLSNVKSRLRQCRAVVATALAPMTGLPTEVLREIFMLVAESDQTSKARIRLSHVSSTWRAISLGLKQLWTVIQVPQDRPDMVHEFATRSGDLRLELYRLPGNEWPEDLELTAGEASRLLGMSSVPPCPNSAVTEEDEDEEDEDEDSEGKDSEDEDEDVYHPRQAALKRRQSDAGTVFTSSLIQQLPLIRLDTLTISGKNQVVLGGMALAKCLRVLDSTIYRGLSFQMERLVDLFADNITGTTLSNVMGSIQAPLLRHLTLSRIWIDREPHWQTEEEDSGLDTAEIERDLTSPFLHGEIASQITSLVIDQCHCGFMTSIFVGWRMSNLTSLTLVLSTERNSNEFIVRYWRMGGGYEDFKETLPHFSDELLEFLCYTPLLHTLDLSISKTDYSWIASIIGMEGLRLAGGAWILPRLRTLYLRDIGGQRNAEVRLLQQVQARSRAPGVERLQELSVSTSFIGESEIEGLRECVDQLNLLAH